MKKQVRMTSNGRITIPIEIRRVLGVCPGDILEFERDGGAFRVRPVKVESPFAKFQGIGNPGIPRGRKAIICHIRKMRGE